MKKSNPLIAYFIDSFEELRRVTWPTRDQTVQLTIIVVIFSLVVAIFLGILDFGFDFAFNSILEPFTTNDQAS